MYQSRSEGGCSWTGAPASRSLNRELLTLRRSDMRGHFLERKGKVIIEHQRAIVVELQNALARLKAHSRNSRELTLTLSRRLPTSGRDSNRNLQRFTFFGCLPKGAITGILTGFDVEAPLQIGNGYTSRLEG